MPSEPQKKSRQREDPRAVEAAIFAACRGKFLTAKEIAEAIGKPFHSVRAYYVYRMAREGSLETQQIDGTKGAKVGARGWTRVYRARRLSR